MSDEPKVSRSMRAAAAEIAVSAPPSLQATVSRGRQRHLRLQIAAAAAVAAIMTSVTLAIAIPDKPDRDLGVAGQMGGRVDTMSASPLAPRAYPAVATNSNTVLFWGGEPGSGNQSGDMPSDKGPDFSDGAIYDVAEDSWQVMSRSPLPARNNAVAAWTGDSFLVAGGITNRNQPSRDAALYEPRSDQWTRIADSPNCPTASAQFASRIFTVGACTSSGADASFFDTATSTWTVLPRTQIGRIAQALQWRGRFLVVGEFGELSVYEGGHWRELTALPNPERSQTFRVAVVDDVVTGVINSFADGNEVGLIYQLVDRNWVSVQSGTWAPSVNVFDQQAFGDDLIWAAEAKLCRTSAATVACVDDPGEANLGRRSTAYPSVADRVVLWGGNAFESDGGSGIESDTVTNRGVVVAFP